MSIHKSAIISDKAEIGNNVSVGPYCIVGPNVKIGENTKLESHVHIVKNTIIGKNNKFATHSVVGGEPQDYKFKGEETYIEIGDYNIFREFITIHRSTKIDIPTKIGNNNMLMVSSHVGHDCNVGDNIIMTNCASIAGHTTVENNAVLSAFVGVHQFCRIGKYAMIGGMSKITQDIPPFCMVAENPSKLIGINVVGLKRGGMTAQDLRDLKDAFKKLFSFKTKLSQTINELSNHANPLVRDICEFMRNSKRGILTKRAGEVIN